MSAFKEMFKFATFGTKMALLTLGAVVELVERW